MGYFDGLTDGAFKTDSLGRTIYYPWGVMGRGRVIDDPVQASALRTFMRRYYQITLPICIVAGWAATQRTDWTWLGVCAAVIVAGLAFFMLKTQRMLVGTPYSDERISFGDAYRNSARGHNRTTLWILLTISVVLALAGLPLMFGIGGSPFSGLFTFGFFAGCAGVFGYMLKSKDN